jgi:SAM-dependent methyltransferase
LEKVSCDLCGSGASSPFFEREDRFTGKSFQFVSCQDCGLIYLNPRPTQAELPEFYPQDYEAYYLTGDASHSMEQWHKLRALKMQLDFVQKLVSGRGRLLDVGCATGNFMRTAREYGWEVTGVELIEPAAQTARQQYGLDVHSGSVDTADLPKATFDVITLWDVLEHLPSPKVAMKRIHQLLKPGGIVVFSIPNLSSFDRFLFGERWIGWDAPRHFNMFTEATIRRLFEQTGFEFKQRSCFLGGKGTFLLSLDQVLGNGNPGISVKKLYPILSAMLWPYRKISYLLDRGPIITFAGGKIG